MNVAHIKQTSEQEAWREETLSIISHISNWLENKSTDKNVNSLVGELSNLPILSAYTISLKEKTFADGISVVYLILSSKKQHNEITIDLIMENGKKDIINASETNAWLFGFSSAIKSFKFA